MFSAFDTSPPHRFKPQPGSHGTPTRLPPSLVVSTTILMHNYCCPTAALLLQKPPTTEPGAFSSHGIGGSFGLVVGSIFLPRLQRRYADPRLPCSLAEEGSVGIASFDEAG